VTSAAPGQADDARTRRRVARQRRFDWVFARPAAFGAFAAVALATASLGPTWLLLLSVVLLQVGLTRGWLRLLSVPSPIGAGVVGMGAALTVDLLLVFHGTKDPLRDMGLVLAFSLLAGLVHQISRVDRVGLTQSLSATLALAGLAVSASAFLALPDVHDTGALVLLGLPGCGPRRRRGGAAPAGDGDAATVVRRCRRHRCLRCGRAARSARDGPGRALAGRPDRGAGGRPAHRRHAARADGEWGAPA
jgi:hypothetical protein